MAQPAYSIEHIHTISMVKTETVISIHFVILQCVLLLLLAGTPELRNMPIICSVFHSIMFLLFKPEFMVMFAFPHKISN
jgi:hypothetical protein